jgi:hypothetical protein
MVEFLIENGADPRIKDEKVGGTPADWATHAHYDDIAQYLNSRT